MTRRGIGGARLCDQAPCGERWPCAKHGTRTIGDYEHLGRHAGEFLLEPLPFRGFDMVWCAGCRYARCSCPPAPAMDALPVGWEKLDSDRGAFFEHTSGARVWSCGATGCVRWGYNRRYIPDLPYEAATCCGERGKLTRAEAMAAALANPLCVEHVDTGHDCVTWKQIASPPAAAPSARAKPALRPGWTCDADGEGYFNDHLALMVCREPDGKWHIFGNGDPWPQGFKRPDAWSSERNAMHFAEIFALNCAGERDRHPMRHGLDFRVEGDDNSGALGA